ncbi:peroxidase 9-like [Pyrus x bretschneideri]|uniref:peroxidase 9-like n=1 Tax=Pyrus x bretschneideri TaxID=225117 RepID=UPI00202EDCDD|nr:peroxidase 9-like [Pyrus x bretschneideri]
MSYETAPWIIPSALASFISFSFRDPFSDSDDPSASTFFPFDYEISRPFQLDPRFHMQGSIEVSSQFRRTRNFDVYNNINAGGHTIGFAKCLFVRQTRKSVCPRRDGDNTPAPLDFVSPTRFDNSYFKLVLGGHGLLPSDQVLLTGNGRQAAELVKTYAANESLFFQQFAKSMVKMGNINPLTGLKGQVRKNCRHVN